MCRYRDARTHRVALLDVAAQASPVIATRHQIAVHGYLYGSAALTFCAIASIAVPPPHIGEWREMRMSGQRDGQALIVIAAIAALAGPIVAGVIEEGVRRHCDLDARVELLCVAAIALPTRPEGAGVCVRRSRGLRDLRQRQKAQQYTEDKTDPAGAVAPGPIGDHTKFSRQAIKGRNIQFCCSAATGPAGSAATTCGQQRRPEVPAWTSWNPVRHQSVVARLRHFRYIL